MKIGNDFFGEDVKESVKFDETGKGSLHMEFKKKYLLRSVAGEHILVYVGQADGGKKRIITMNDTAASVWNAIPAASDDEDVVRAVAEEYGMEPDAVRADCAELLDKFREMGIL